MNKDIFDEVKSQGKITGRQIKEMVRTCIARVSDDQEYDNYVFAAKKNEGEFFVTMFGESEGLLRCDKLIHDKILQSLEKAGIPKDEINKILAVVQIKSMINPVGSTAVDGLDFIRKIERDRKSGGKDGNRTP